MSSFSKKPVAVMAIRQMARSTGAVRIAQQQIKVLVDLGYHVYVLAERVDKKYVGLDGVLYRKILRWPFKGKWRRIKFNRSVQRWCKRYRPDLLISHGDVENSDVLYMHNCIHLANERLGFPPSNDADVAFIHDRILEGRRFKRLVVNSRLMAEDFKTRYGIDEGSMSVLYPSYDSEIFNVDRAKAARKEMREILLLPDDACLVGLVTSGNFHKRNVEFFVRIAYSLSQKSKKDYRFLVVGDDDPTPYQSLAAAMGIANRFAWLRPMEEVHKVYGALDIFVLPARIEEFGCVVLEAMACGVPVVVSRWIGASELLLTRHPQLVLHDYLPEKWAARIEQACGDKALGEALSRLALNHSHDRQYETLKRNLLGLV